MKKITLSILFVAALLAACKKQEKHLNPVSESEQTITVGSKELSMEELLQNPNNPNAAAFVAQQLKLGRGVLKALQNEETLSEIIAQAQAPRGAPHPPAARRQFSPHDYPVHSPP